MEEKIDSSKIEAAQCKKNTLKGNTLKENTLKENTLKENTLKENTLKGTITDKGINPYVRQAKYYETDQMAVVHHSNYIRWFEEARIDFLEQIGLGYDKIEAAGVYSPVLGVSCKYKSSVRFNETVLITAKLRLFDGIKMKIEYQVIDAETKQVRAVGSSDHCFVSTDFKPVSLKKNQKEMYDILIRFVE